MADDAKIIDEAVEKFRALMESQLARAKKIKEDKEFTDYDALDTIVIVSAAVTVSALSLLKKVKEYLRFYLKTKLQAAKLSLKKLTV